MKNKISLVAVVLIVILFGIFTVGCKPKETGKETDGVSESKEVGGVSGSKETDGVSESKEVGGVSGSKETDGVSESKEVGGVSGSKESGGVPESKEAGGASGSKEAGGVSESKAVSEISEKDNIQEPERKPAADTEISRRPAAKFTLKELSGSRMVSLKDFRGKPVFIDFWASWCPPCRQATPYIKRIIEEFGDDLYIIGINLDRNKSDALNYIEEENINYMQLKGIGTDIPSKYEVRGIPTFYILDSEGGVVKTYSGFTNRYYREWETILKDLL